MLAAVENWLVPHELNKLSALMPAADTHVDAFRGRGFILKQNLRLGRRSDQALASGSTSM
jgi:hypothetical protein